jgi:GT2 family glycosyltransferase
VLLTTIILTRNNAATMRACLDALARAPEEMEVLLVDNASTDETPAVARQYQSRFRRFEYRRSRRNVAYGAANNEAARGAAGDALLFLNDDVVVAPEAPGLLATAVMRSGAGIAGPKLLFPGGATIQHAGIRQMLWGYASNLGTSASRAEPALNRSGETFAVTGAMLAIRRSFFQHLGGFNERYHWGYEDVDLCLKARRTGTPVRYLSEIESVHAESTTLSRVRHAGDLRWNYGLYRRRWNHRLVPDERAALDRLRHDGVRRVVVFGTGLAARGLFRILTRSGIIVEAFTASRVNAVRFCARPLLPLDEIRRLRFDRLLVGSQHYFAVRHGLAGYDPAGTPLFPLAGRSDLLA